MSSDDYPNLLVSRANPLPLNRYAAGKVQRSKGLAQDDGRLWVFAGETFTRCVIMDFSSGDCYILDGGLGVEIEKKGFPELLVRRDLALLKLLM